MADMDTKTLLKYAGMALVAYLVWDRIIAPMLSGNDEEEGKAVEGGTQPPATGVNNPVGSANPTPANPPNVPRPQTPIIAVPPAPPVTANRMAERLQQLAGSVRQLDVNGWNYYIRQLNPNEVVSDLSEVGVGQGPLLTVDQYLAKRSEAGLTLEVTGRSAGGGGGRGGVQGYFLN
jgi:hypothetical protein